MTSVQHRFNTMLQRPVPLFLRLLLPPFLFLPSTLQAQEHPFLTAYTLTELPGSIRVDWTIEGGNTCDGQEVERSTDSVNFVVVHMIGGLCGDPSIPKSYTWTDEAPPELSTIHYRIKLGVEGYSSIKSIEFDQLTTSAQRFYPNPTDRMAVLLLQLPSGTAVDLVVTDAQGRTVLDLQGHNGPRIELDLLPLPAGVYTYKATGDGRRFTGSFVKA